MRQAAKKDALHQAVGHIWRQCGYQTIDLSGLGDGYPDWLACKDGKAVLLEVKTPGWDRRRISKTLTIQAAFRETWTASPIFVIESVEEAWLQAEMTRS